MPNSEGRSMHGETEMKVATIEAESTLNLPENNHKEA